MLTAIHDVIITSRRSWYCPFRGHSIITPSLGGVLVKATVNKLNLQCTLLVFVVSVLRCFWNIFQMGKCSSNYLRPKYAWACKIFSRPSFVGTFLSQIMPKKICFWQQGKKFKHEMLFQNSSYDVLRKKINLYFWVL